MTLVEEWPLNHFMKSILGLLETSQHNIAGDPSTDCKSIKGTGDTIGLSIRFDMYVYNILCEHE